VRGSPRPSSLSYVGTSFLYQRQLAGAVGEPIGVVV
jgi:hypothetical protein